MTKDRLALYAQEIRLQTFERAWVTGSKSRAKKNFKAWPHTSPTPQAVAMAGFYFNPSTESGDNVTCFMCQHSLDGWELDDDPKQEHLAHAPGCAWAQLTGRPWTELEADDEAGLPTLDGTEYNPHTDDMLSMRLETFEFWPHDSKRGWVPTSLSMARSGFYYNPVNVGDDVAKCAYCEMELDGWEPKDDPVAEHRRRNPECLFFTSHPPDEIPPAQKAASIRVSKKRPSSSPSDVVRNQKEIKKRKSNSRTPAPKISRLSIFESDDDELPTKATRKQAVSAIDDTDDSFEALTPNRRRRQRKVVSYDESDSEITSNLSQPDLTPASEQSVEGEANSIHIEIEKPVLKSPVEVSKEKAPEVESDASEESLEEGDASDVEMQEPVPAVESEYPEVENEIATDVNTESSDAGTDEGPADFNDTEAHEARELDGADSNADSGAESDVVAISKPRADSDVDIESEAPEVYSEVEQPTAEPEIVELPVQEDIKEDAGIEADEDAHKGQQYPSRVEVPEALQPESDADEPAEPEPEEPEASGQSSATIRNAGVNDANEFLPALDDICSKPQSTLDVTDTLGENLDAFSVTGSSVTANWKRFSSSTTDSELVVPTTMPRTTKAILDLASLAHPVLSQIDPNVATPSRTGKHILESNWKSASVDNVFAVLSGLRSSKVADQIPEEILDTTIAEWVRASAAESEKHLQASCDQLIAMVREEGNTAIEALRGMLVSDL